MKELIVKYRDLEEYGVRVKQYLSPAEIELIVTNLLAEQDLFKRELLRKYYILKYCTNIEVDENFDIELAVESGLYDSIEFEMSNLCEIEYMINKHETTTVVVKDFLQKIELKMPDAKTQKSMITKLQKMSKEFAPKSE